MMTKTLQSLVSLAALTTLSVASAIGCSSGDKDHPLATGNYATSQQTAWSPDECNLTNKVDGPASVSFINGTVPKVVFPALDSVTAPPGGSVTGGVGGERSGNNFTSSFDYDVTYPGACTQHTDVSIVGSVASDNVFHAVFRETVADPVGPACGAAATIIPCTSTRSFVGTLAP